MHVDVNDISWEIDAVKIIDRVRLHAETGEFIGVIGPNGSGKSTLLRLIYRLMKPSAGIITLNERDLWVLTARETAQSMAVVAQERTSDFDFTVEEVVMMGRTPHKRPLDRDTDDDRTLVSDALRRVDLPAFAHRLFHTLSGGEKQRVLVARALAQQARVLILDEPTNHLDIRYQLEILELVKSLNVTAIGALHDLNLAATYCDRLYLLQTGRIVAEGKPAHVLTPVQIGSVYSVKAEVEIHPATGHLHIVYHGVLQGEGAYHDG